MSSSKNLEYKKTSFLNKSNSAFIEQLYLKFINKDSDLPESWKNYFLDIGDELDLIANGQREWKASLNDFWNDFNTTVQNTLKLSNSEVYDYVNENMGDYLFPKIQDDKDSRLCPKCKNSPLSIKMRKNGSGPFVACTSHPECDFIRGQVFPSDDQTEET